jgi:hypothetical protein
LSVAALSGAGGSAQSLIVFTRSFACDGFAGKVPEYELVKEAAFGVSDEQIAANRRGNQKIAVDGATTEFYF